MEEGISDIKDGNLEITKVEERFESNKKWKKLSNNYLTSSERVIKE